MRALLFTLVLGASLGAAPAVKTDAGLGSAAPSIALTSLDGTPRRVVAIPGKITVVNFWATWCPPCRAETPDMVAAYQRLHAKGVEFVGIDTTETAPIVKTFVSAKDVKYPIALGNAAGYNAYGITHIPTTLVLDADGVVRARWVGRVTPTQLAHYVADARARRSTAYVSSVQRSIDAQLSPRRFRFAGSASQRAATVTAVERAVRRVDALTAHDESQVDYERTSHEQGTLLYAAGEAERNAAATTRQRVDGLVLMARGLGAGDDWAGAARAYREALSVSPDDPELVDALGRAYYRVHDYSRMIVEAKRYAQLRPGDGDGWSELGLAFQRAHRLHDATAAYEKSLALLKSAALTKPSENAVADVADTSLDAANVYVALGNVGDARRTFAVANAYADRLAADGIYAALKRNVKERTQEGMVAVALAGRSAKPLVSVAPWTGPDLPGSLASTLKYRLIVVAPVDAAVTLRAQGLRPQWIASFCADGLCSPRAVSFKSPASGVKTYEFQLVPPQGSESPGNVAIAVGGGSRIPVPAAAH